MSESVAMYLPSQALLRVRQVWYSGTGALESGQAVCYNSDKGTATEADASRGAECELPSSSNNLYFAGVTTRAYTAEAAGQVIEIYEPGSYCPVAINVDTVLNSGIVTFSVAEADAGLFVAKGLPGRGSARICQTNASGVKFSSLDGSASIAADGITLTKTGIGTAATVGDYVYILAGGVAGTGATVVTVGRYTVASITSADVIVISSAVCAAASAVAVTLRSATAPPTAFCYLMDGPESGGVQWTTPVVSAASDPVPMVGGTTLIAGGLTLAGDSTATLANGLAIGDKKSFWCMGPLTTQDFLLTTTTATKSADNSALANIEFDAAGEMSTLLWSGGTWRAQTTGATEA